MNLTKLFNFKYFKENLKKSKGAVALLLIIIPIFTTLYTVLILNTADTISTPDKTELMIVNIMGMYIIPVVMSGVLFGYVYQKKSVDFINSQPINRKTIFITNTVGGIILMAIIQAITALMLLICSLILPNLIIFPAMILDIFIVMWISYVFMFVVTNMAMSVSGTFCTQVVLTMLVLFLVPFFMDCYYDFSNGFNYELINEEKTYNQYVHRDDYYTMPYQIFHSIFSNQTSEFDWYSSKIISRMIVLGAVYYFIGLHLFKSRKMENNEESFFNEKMHIVVKALTILPMMLLLNMADAGKEFNIITIAVIITYYFIYDFIVKRKIKLKASIIYLVLTMIALQGICSSVEAMKEAVSMEKLNVNNIASIKFNTINEEMGNTYYLSNVTTMGGFVEDKEIIKMIFDSSYKYNNIYEGETLEQAETFATDIEAVETKTYSKGEKRVYCDITVKTQSGKKYTMGVTILQEEMDNILKKLSEDEKYVSKIRNSIIQNSTIVISNCKILKNEEKEIIASEIENKINSMSLEEIRQMSKNESAVGINRYYYKNHKLIGIPVNDAITSKTLEIVSNYMNKEVVAKLREFDDYRRPSFKVYNRKSNSPTDWLYLDYANEDVYDFILESENEVFDANKPYYTIELGLQQHLQFYTNNLEKIEEFISKELESREEYENYINYEMFKK